MATFSNLPGGMHLAIKRGDNFATLVDFDVVMTGYSVSAEATSLVNSQHVFSIPAVLSDSGAGQVSLSMTSTATAALASGTYGWSLSWIAPGSTRRTVLSGTLEVVP